MIPVLYTDKDFLVCSKPVGVLSESPGLPDIVQEQLGGRFYPVHRLDQGTGGVCVLAATAHACTGLQKLFLEGRVGFLQIAALNRAAMENAPAVKDFTVEDVFAADAAAREFVRARV